MIQDGTSIVIQDDCQWKLLKEEKKKKDGKEPMKLKHQSNEKKDTLLPVCLYVCLCTQRIKKVSLVSAKNHTCKYSERTTHIANAILLMLLYICICNCIRHY